MTDSPATPTELVTCLFSDIEGSTRIELALGTGPYRDVRERHRALLREAFLAQAHRLAPELVVVDSAVRPDHEREEWQTRVLNDGSRHRVYKRYFDADELAAELGGGTVLHASDWFVMVTTGDRVAPTR